MTEPPHVVAGVDRSHGRSPAQKITFTLIHAASLGICAHIAFGGSILLSIWHGSWRAVDPFRAEIVLAVTALYALRSGITLFYLLRRRFSWPEAIGLGIMMLVFETGSCLLAAGLTRRVPVPLGWTDALAVGLVLAGSFLNTYAELQRSWWKDKPENGGRCYTGGLFAWSRHINYFGDCVLFTGWSLLTAEMWMLAVPAGMALMFVFYHIPGLESYLEARYGNEFSDYRRRTKCLIPLLY